MSQQATLYYARYRCCVLITVCGLDMLMCASKIVGVGIFDLVNYRMLNCRLQSHKINTHTRTHAHMLTPARYHCDIWIVGLIHYLALITRIIRGKNGGGRTASKLSVHRKMLNS